MMQRLASGSVTGAIEHRLYGSINRIAWRPEDVSAVVSRFGAQGDRAPVSQLARLYQAPPAAPAVAEKAAADSDRTFTFTISSATVDRMGDTIAVSTELAEMLAGGRVPKANQAVP